LTTPTKSNDNEKKEFKKSYIICSVMLGRRVGAGENPPMTEKEILEGVAVSDADPGCLSRILIITHPGSKNSNKREG
jgi:hypothetical protein